ncbi:MAG: DUF2283 domain-containing protein [Phycisphaerae bacterium]
MRLAYDTKTDSLYIHLSDTPAADSDEAAPGVVLDFAPPSDAAGKLVGIDVQHASTVVDLTQLVSHHLPAATVKLAS